MKCACTIFAVSFFCLQCAGVDFLLACYLCLQGIFLFVVFSLSLSGVPFGPPFRWVSKLTPNGREDNHFNILKMYIIHFNTQSGAFQKYLVKNMKKHIFTFQWDVGYIPVTKFSKRFHCTISAIKSHSGTCRLKLKTVD